MSNETKKPVVKKLTPKKEASPMNGAMDASEGPMVDAKVPPIDPNAPRELTIGEQLIGCNFEIPQEEINDVVNVKLISAELVNILTAAMQRVEGGVSAMRADLYKKAIQDISDAQMNIVKVLTFKF
jgi:hypothetical protein